MTDGLEDWKKESLEFQIMYGEIEGKPVPCIFLEKPIMKKNEIIEFIRKGGKGVGGWNILMESKTNQMSALMLNLEFGDITDLKFLFDPSVVDMNYTLSFMLMLIESNGTLILDDGNRPSIGIRNMSLETPKNLIQDMEKIFRKMKF